MRNRYSEQLFAALITCLLLPSPYVYSGQRATTQAPFPWQTGPQSPAAPAQRPAANQAPFPWQTGSKLPATQTGSGIRPASASSPIRPAAVPDGPATWAQIQSITTGADVYTANGTIVSCTGALCGGSLAPGNPFRFALPINFAAKTVGANFDFCGPPGSGNEDCFPNPRSGISFGHPLSVDPILGPYFQYYENFDPQSYAGYAGNAVLTFPVSPVDGSLFDGSTISLFNRGGVIGKNAILNIIVQNIYPSVFRLSTDAVRAGGAVPPPPPAVAVAASPNPLDPNLRPIPSLANGAGSAPIPFLPADLLAGLEKQPPPCPGNALTPHERALVQARKDNKDNKAAAATAKQARLAHSLMSPAVKAWQKELTDKLGALTNEFWLKQMEIESWPSDLLEAKHEALGKLYDDFEQKYMALPLGAKSKISMLLAMLEAKRALLWGEASAGHWDATNASKALEAEYAQKIAALQNPPAPGGTGGTTQGVLQGVPGSSASGPSMSMGTGETTQGSAKAFGGSTQGAGPSASSAEISGPEPSGAGSGPAVGGVQQNAQQIRGEMDSVNSQISALTSSLARVGRAQELQTQIGAADAGGPDLGHEAMLIQQQISTLVQQKNALGQQLQAVTQSMQTQQAPNAGAAAPAAGKGAAKTATGGGGPGPTVGELRIQYQQKAQQIQGELDSARAGFGVIDWQYKAARASYIGNVMGGLGASERLGGPENFARGIVDAGKKAGRFDQQYQAASDFLRQSDSYHQKVEKINNLSGQLRAVTNNIEALQGKSDGAAAPVNGER